jgi:hypothetical protein
MHFLSDYTIIGFAAAGDGRFVLFRGARMIGMQQLPTPPPTPYELALMRQRELRNQVNG